MTKDQFTRESNFRLSMAVFKEMLRRGIIPLCNSKRPRKCLRHDSTLPMAR